MRRIKHITCGLLVTAAVTLLIGCQTVGKSDQNGQSNVRIHYLEIVSQDVGAQCAALEQMHGLSFGPAAADLGQARVAEAPDGSLIGVRAPLAQHEQPIIRTYLEVEDIARAVEEAEAAGAAIAYPPTRQGETGTWAIYILGDVQIGLWQR
jgi:predicted enzyme related to lactoylglutathione lyase